MNIDNHINNNTINGSALNIYFFTFTKGVLIYQKKISVGINILGAAKINDPILGSELLTK